MTAIIKRNLQQREEIIAHALTSGFEIGEQLLAIRDEKQYHPQFDTFEGYCKDRWKISRPSAYQFIDIFVTQRDLSTIVDMEMKKLPGKALNQEQAKALSGVSNDSKKQAIVFTAAVESAPKDKDGNSKVTGSLLKKTAESLGIRKPKKAPAKPRKPLAPKANDAAHPLPIPDREPGDQETEPEHKGPLLDATKGHVCVGLTAVFECAHTYRGLQNELGSILKKIEELANGPSGGRLDIQECQRLSEQLRVQLKFAAPHTECVKCRRNWDRKCQHCKGTGWLTKTEFSACASDADKGWLSSRKAK